MDPRCACLERQGDAPADGPAVVKGRFGAGLSASTAPCRQIRAAIGEREQKNRMPTKSARTRRRIPTGSQAESCGILGVDPARLMGHEASSADLG